MKGAPKSGEFWAKLERDDQRNIVAWHPLNHHCADVAACASVLLRRTILHDRFARLMGQDHLEEVQIQRLCALVALPDAGKANHGFQRRAHSPSHEGGARSGHLSPIIDAFDAYRSLPVAEDVLYAVRCDVYDSWVDPQGDKGALPVLMAVFSHHGRPISAQAHALKQSLWRADELLDHIAGVR